MRIKNKDDIKKGMAFLVELSPEFKHISTLVDQVPLRLAKPHFEDLASIIVSQQVSKASAAAIFGRLTDLINPLTADSFLKEGENAWIKAGLSKSKQSALNLVAEAIIAKQIDLEGLCNLKAEDAMKSLTQLKGIGPWTAEVYLMSCAGHPDIFPAGDVALQEAVKQAFNLQERPSEKRCRALSRAWSPWRSVAARLLWEYYGVVKNGRDAAPVG